MQLYIVFVGGVRSFRIWCEELLHVLAEGAGPSAFLIASEGLSFPVV